MVPTGRRGCGRCPACSSTAFRSSPAGRARRTWRAAARASCRAKSPLRYASPPFISYGMPNSADEHRVGRPARLFLVPPLTRRARPRTPPSAQRRLLVHRYFPATPCASQGDDVVPMAAFDDSGTDRPQRCPVPTVSPSMKEQQSRCAARRSADDGSRTSKIGEGVIADGPRRFRRRARQVGEEQQPPSSRSTPQPAATGSRPARSKGHPGFEHLAAPRAEHHAGRSRHVLQRLPRCRAVLVEDPPAHHHRPHAPADVAVAGLRRGVS